MVGKGLMSVWIPTFALVVLASLVASPASAQEHTTPPELVEFSFSPTWIDVSNAPQAVTVTLRKTDNLAGVALFQIPFLVSSQYSIPCGPPPLGRHLEIQHA